MDQKEIVRHLKKHPKNAARRTAWDNPKHHIHKYKDGWVFREWNGAKDQMTCWFDHGWEIYGKDHSKMLDTIKEKALELREVTKPFEKYLVIALALYVVDYFIFKGKYTDKLLSIASKAFERAASTLETGLNKILGE